MSENEFSYCDLRAKEVVNACDGKRLGRIVDLLFSREDGTISGIVVPLSKRSVFAKNQDVFIPWRCVQKIGADVILVNLTVDGNGNLTCETKEPPKNKDKCEQGGAKCAQPPLPGCDFRCEKCMLFDCAYRWSQTN